MISLLRRVSRRARGTLTTLPSTRTPRRFHSNNSNTSQPETRTHTPHYGDPRPETSHSSLLSRVALTIHSATTAFADPTRADAVAKLGELTGPVSLQSMLKRMAADPTGRLILQERPIVSKETIPFQQLIDSAAIPSISGASESSSTSSQNKITFGQAYGGMVMNTSMQWRSLRT